MSRPLEGRRIAFLATDGVEQDELTIPWIALREAGAETELIALRSGSIRSVRRLEPGREFPVDAIAREARVSDYDGLVLPGGVVNPDTLRLDRDAVRFVAGFFHQRKPVAAICHGPWTLIEAGVVRDRTLTSWPSLRTDIENAGGRWIDAAVHVDDLLVTSRKPEDLDAFCSSAVEAFSPVAAAAG